MIIIYISQRACGGHQTTSNNHYDAGIVLIDLHQLNVKTTSDNKQISDTGIRGKLKYNEEQETRRTTTRNIRFS